MLMVSDYHWVSYLAPAKFLFCRILAFITMKADGDGKGGRVREEYTVIKINFKIPSCYYKIY